MTRAPETDECPICRTGKLIPDAEPYGDWVWECDACFYREFEKPDRANGKQRLFARYFAETRRYERADWLAQYRLQPERVR
jgi:hypothetical protein